MVAMNSDRSVTRERRWPIWKLRYFTFMGAVLALVLLVIIFGILGWLNPI
jgi:hypothetical protein